MERKKLYESTCDIILDAYNKKELEHWSSCGCFIGNIVKRRYKGTEFPGAWYSAVCRNASKDQPLHVLEQIKSTGYSLEEIIMLENAFEKAAFLEKLDKNRKPITQYEGMKAALNKLAEIHNTPSKESIEKLDKIQELVYN